MEKVEVNVNSLALDGVRKVDFDIEKNCFLLIFENGQVQEVYL